MFATFLLTLNKISKCLKIYSIDVTFNTAKDVSFNMERNAQAQTASHNRANVRGEIDPFLQLMTFTTDPWMRILLREAMKGC